MIPSQIYYYNFLLLIVKVIYSKILLETVKLQEDGKDKQSKLLFNILIHYKKLIKQLLLPILEEIHLMMSNIREKIQCNLNLKDSNIK